MEDCGVVAIATEADGYSDKAITSEISTRTGLTWKQ